MLQHKNTLHPYVFIAIAATAALVTSCSSNTNDTPEVTHLISKTIQIPRQIKNASKSVWLNDQSYLILPYDSFVIYKITGESIDTLPRTAKFPASRTSYESGFIQNVAMRPFLIDAYGGVYAISDSIKKYPLPASSLPGIHSASLTNSGNIYACGVAGVWKVKPGDSTLRTIPKLHAYNTRALYIDDTIGIISRRNTITIFKNDTATKIISFNEIGIPPSTTSGFTSDWIGKMNGYYYVFQDLSGIKLSPAGDVISVFTAPSNQIVSFTDGDCFFTKRMDLDVWCDDGKNVATFTSTSSDLDDEMIFAGKNSQGYWIANKSKLILLDLEKAKSIARNH